MPTPQATEEFYTTLQRIQLALVVAGRRAWSRMLPDFDLGWSRIVAPLVQVTSAAQLAAAAASTAYVPAVLDETGQPDRPEALIQPRAFAGVSSDGRSLATALQGAVVASKQAARGRIVRDGDVTHYLPGVGSDRALDYGQKWLEMALQTAVSDAARDATAAQIAVRQSMGWVRMVNPPCCSRCAVLAGKWYRWNEGFLRHPRCDCVHIPSAENVSGDYVTDPKALIDRGLVTDLTPTQLERIGEGADLARVLNETRDAWRARMALQRKREKARLKGPTTWGDAQPLPPGGIQDFLSHLTSRVDAINEMKRHGIAT